MPSGTRRKRSPSRTGLSNQAGSARKPRQSRQREVWEDAYRHALRQYGNRKQAERIAWGKVEEKKPKRISRG